MKGSLFDFIYDCSVLRLSRGQKPPLSNPSKGPGYLQWGRRFPVDGGTFWPPAGPIGRAFRLLLVSSLRTLRSTAWGPYLSLEPIIISAAAEYVCYGVRN